MKVLLKAFQKLGSSGSTGDGGGVCAVAERALTITVCHMLKKNSIPFSEEIPFSEHSTLKYREHVDFG